MALLRKQNKSLKNVQLQLQTEVSRLKDDLQYTRQQLKSKETEQAKNIENIRREVKNSKQNEQNSQQKQEEQKYKLEL